MSVTGHIYCLTCKVGGKKYVGQTVLTPKKRFKGHWNQSRHGDETPLHRALRKYGKESFELSVLEKCASITKLNSAETRWIKKLGTFGKGGYNCTTGGEGFIMSAATKKKMSKAVKGKPRSETHRRAVSLATRGEGNPFYGKKHKASSIRRMKCKLSEKFSGEGNPFYGKKHPPEVMERIKASLRGKPMHPNTRAGIAKANKGNQYTKGRRITVEHKEKYSKLTTADVLRIKSNPEGLTQTEFARRLGVTWWAVHNVLIGRTWKDVSV